jgi:iron complex outermembrane recepter protein
MIPKSLLSVGGACTLPTALSGDPYLPQIFANSFEVGMGGKLFENIDWNASLYRTDLENDIYLVSITTDRSFFDTIGNTRRQGVEFGFSGKAGIVDFSLNYGLTDATFQSDLLMVSRHNSSSENRNASIEQEFINSGTNNFNGQGRPIKAVYDMEKINAGDRMPGIPLHNINASVTIHLTPKWEFGVAMIAHSSSFVRGNENNDHQQGGFDQVEQVIGYDPVSGMPQYGLVATNRQFKDSGSIPGYAIFNLKTRYEVTKGLSVFGMVNNLFDRQFATAGRLGINPFSPSQNGFIGWNYNSSEWQSSTFVGPGAPRAFWVGFDFRFDI